MAANDIIEQTEQSPRTGRDRAPDIDVAAMQAILDGPYAPVRDAARQALVDHADLLTDAETLSRDEFRDRVLEAVRALTAENQTNRGLPAEYGGGGDIGASIAAFETMAYGDGSMLVKIGVQFGLFGGAIAQLGTERHHAKYLPDIAAGRLLGCFAMTETGHGSDVAALGTTARYDAETGEFVIHTAAPEANKDYIGNAARHGEAAVVFAQLEVDGASQGVHAFVVPIRSGGETLPGVRITDDGLKMGLNGVDNGRIWFDQVRIPRENLLNRFADVDEFGVYSSPIESPNKRFFTMLGTLVQGRVSVGGAGVNAAKAALTIAIRYANRRRQFATGDGEEELLLDYGMHQARLLPLLARTYALHFAQDVVRSQLHEVFSAPTSGPGAPSETTRRELEARAAGTKAVGTWHATRTIQECREACGGAGYLAENRFAGLKADTDVFATFEGDNHVLLQLVGKGLLTGYQQGFNDLDQLGMVRFVAETAVDTLVERSAVHKLFETIKDALPGGRDDRWDQDAGLRDPNYHRAMFRFREEHLLETLARRLKGGIDAGEQPGVVFSRVQEHLISTARAHQERLVLEAFLDRIEELPEGPERSALNLVADLYALDEIARDRGWFAEHGRLSTPRSKAITREVGALQRELRPIAEQLVDAFGVPREALRAEALIGDDG